MRNNRRSDLFENNHIPIPVDMWEIFPDNILLDDSTFLARGNFGQVYRAELATATKSPNESYHAGTLVAVKILQGDEMYKAYQNVFSCSYNFLYTLCILLYAQWYCVFEIH